MGTLIYDPLARGYRRDDEFISELELANAQSPWGSAWQETTSSMVCAVALPTMEPEPVAEPVVVTTETVGFDDRFPDCNASLAKMRE